ncbi:MAG: hypothetical protein KF784_05550 [Fimbriimonadaceae bacterium]|nr:hypothetical protein [Fimbriimonadaceae bacterium]
MAEYKGKFLGVNWDFKLPLWLEVAGSVFAGLFWLLVALTYLTVDAYQAEFQVTYRANIEVIGSSHPWFMNLVTIANDLVPFVLIVGALFCFRKYSRVASFSFSLFFVFYLPSVANVLTFWWMAEISFWASAFMAAVWYIGGLVSILASVFDAAHWLCLKLGWYKHYVRRSPRAHSNATLT